MAALLSGCVLAASALAEERSAAGLYTSDDEHEELLATTQASSGSCGVERWSVKTGTDADVGLVDMNDPVIQTISYLRGLTAPSTLPANNRIQPTETTMFVVDATLVEYKLETDSDYHLVIKDSAGNTMIAEIPDPACVGAGSPFANLIQNARSTFDAKYSATTSFQTANIPVQLTGIGFFDFQHGQTGVAPNAIELHPVLDIVFNPSTGGNADFSLSASPGTVTVQPGATATTTITETPANGFTGSVALSATGLPSGVTASFNPSSTTGSSTLTFTASSSAAAGTSTVTVKGVSGSLSHTATVTLTVNPSGGGGGLTAVYNSTLTAPWCSTVGSSCDSGPSLLLGRGNISGGAEPNQPNTINNSCADGTSGTFHSSESIDRLVVASADGSPLTAGKSVKVTATVWAYSTADALDLYSAANANSPSWVFLSTINPTAAGAQTLSTSFTLPSGGLQAVRGNFRYQGSASSCSTGSYDDHDDLIFAVNSSAPAPDFTIAAAPTSVGVTPGASTSDTIAISPQNGFTGSVALSASGLPTGVTASFSPTSTTGSSTLTLTAASSAPAGTATVTITGTSGSLTHTTTLSLTVNAATATELVTNGGFESGSTGWTATSGVITASGSGETAHTGSYLAWLDGYGTTTTDTLSQTVTIPSTITTATFSFWLHIDTAETTTTTAHDTLTVQLQSSSGTVLTTLATYSNLNKNTGYAQKTFDVSAYKGQTVKLYFKGVENSSLQTSFVIDDVSLKVQ
ncbi:MAG TPA: hypothetical protein VFB32_05000 [Rudaea sp.]|nr:hypothetical protein [Rudaea sp.]